jgi:crotonobetainyl-CoA:carnitine CoA-transferase CaiB-like acyl-CoA transferase
MPAMGEELIAGLLEEVVGLPGAVAERVAVVGDDRPFATPFPVVDCAASALGSVGAVASLLWEERTGEAQAVRSTGATRARPSSGSCSRKLDGDVVPIAPGSLDRPVVRLYCCRDGRWVHLHGAFPHLAALTCDVLGCSVESPADLVAERVALWDGQALEDALAEAGACGAMARATGEWAAHPQAAAIAPLGRVSIEKIGESAPEAPRGTRRPLDGVRVLDLSRLLAGPTNGRTLAEHGAEVLLVNSPRLDNIPLFVMDTSHGKRSRARRP